MTRRTLHEAMTVVLRRHGGGWLDRDTIAEVIAEEQLYVRPSDGEPPPSDQLRLRARKYPQIFECSDTACRKIRLRDVDEPAGDKDERSDPSVQPRRVETSKSDVHAQRREQAAKQYQPEAIRLLLVAESPPTALDRYFYFEDVTAQDSLFRYVIRSILGAEPTRARKPELLARLRDAGVFLIDLKPDPLDGRSLRQNVPELVPRIVSLDPHSVILIKATVYDAAFVALQRRGLPVVDERVPFPGSGQQKRYEPQVRLGGHPIIPAT